MIRRYFSRQVYPVRSQGWSAGRRNPSHLSHPVYRRPGLYPYLLPALINRRSCFVYFLLQYPHRQHRRRGHTTLRPATWPSELPLRPPPVHRRRLPPEHFVSPPMYSALSRRSCPRTTRMAGPNDDFAGRRLPRRRIVVAAVDPNWPALETKALDHHHYCRYSYPHHCR